MLGDLVVAGCLIAEEKESGFKELGVKDSKLLTPKEREKLYVDIVKESKYEIIPISAEEIDERNKVGCNLNKLECIKMAQIINALNPDKVIIDCPHPIPEKFEREIASYVVNKKTKIVAEHKADFNYPVVGAASILAKVTRDRRLRDIEKVLGIELGSGYPHDPKTREVIKNAVGNNSKELHKYIRHSWSTYKDEKKMAEQKKMADF
ncbi:Ribonuclease HII [Candidatus Tiddalikarchaeum anstoanum]|nr:Ribonuclease HII [Candidatus Tiddalikarchaeum anstoanum]